MDVGFLILSPDRNISGVRGTLASIKNNSYGRDSICVVGEDTSPKDLKEMKELCPTYKGDSTITSLINVGMNKIKHDWAFIVFGGSKIPISIEKKWDIFCKAETDVLFPVVEGRWDFIEGSFNGVMINTRFFRKVGDFPTVSINKDGLNDFEFVKMLWAVSAIENNVTFKAIVGMKIM